MNGRTSLRESAFLTVLMMPLTFSIATGIAIGFILYPLIKIFAGKGKKVHPILYVLGAVFIARFVFLGASESRGIYPFLGKRVFCFP